MLQYHLFLFQLKRKCKPKSKQNFQTTVRKMVSKRWWWNLTGTPTKLGVSTLLVLLNGSLWGIGGAGWSVAQHVAGDPALSGWALICSGTEHQEHILLVWGQDLHHLTLTHINLILFQSHIVLRHEHCGNVTAAAAFTLWTSTHKWSLVCNTQRLFLLDNHYFS